MISLLTLHTLQWAMNNHNGSFMLCESADDIKRLVWKYKLPVKNEENWVKGAKQNDFNALYEWLVDYKKEHNVI